MGFDDAVRRSQAQEELRLAKLKWAKRYGLLPDHSYDGEVHEFSPKDRPLVADFLRRGRKFTSGIVVPHPDGTRQLLFTKHRTGLRGLVTQQARRRDGERVRYKEANWGSLRLRCVRVFSDGVRFAGAYPTVGTLEDILAEALVR
jgi:hypothetical protein